MEHGHSRMAHDRMPDRDAGFLILHFEFRPSLHSFLISHCTSQSRSNRSQPSVRISPADRRIELVLVWNLAAEMPGSASSKSRKASPAVKRAPLQRTPTASRE